jgi:micrococcal nuclease
VALFPSLLQGACLQPDPDSLQLHRVEQIHDGDTVRMVDGEKVRLIGLNTPEVARKQRPAEPLAAAASERLRQLLGESPQIRLRPGAESRDRYGRLLAYGFTVEGRDIAATLIAEGLAFALVVPPNLWNSDCYPEQEVVARRKGLGIWSEPVYQARPLSQVREGGFQRIRGVVQRVEWSKRWLWLDLADQISVQIAKSDLPHFEGRVDLLALQGAQITLQGWLVPRKKGYRLRLHHPSAIKVE